LRAVVVERDTYAQRARAFTEMAIETLDRPRVAIKIGAPRQEQAHEWGDFHFAHSLIRAMSTHGFSGETHILPEWDAPNRQDVDVVIHLRGLTTYAPKAAHVNIMWLISHPDDVTPEECDKYDLVCVASKPLADELRSQVKPPVVSLPQATDAKRFGAAEPDDGLRTDALFVGNSRNQNRDAVDWAIEAGAPLTVYGNGWDGLIPSRYVRDRYFPNEDLGRLYVSASLVLNDHWPDMRRWGIVSNRILDALAAGAFVISDPVEGLEELVGDAVPTFSSPEELSALLDKYLTDPDAREALTARGRRRVLEHHTFEQRAASLVELIWPLLDGRLRDCDGNRFSALANGWSPSDEGDHQ
jgi:glycosyltransferase involved in cell wall biosynthesis